MSRLALFLFGPPRIELGGEPVHISRRKAVALLAYLAVTGTSHSRSALATLLWPDCSHSRARAYLRRALSELNRTLEEGFLTIDRETAVLDHSANLLLDVAVFRKLLEDAETHDHPRTELCSDCVTLLERAVELYSDDFMAGFTLRDSPDFDEWQFFERQALREALAGALERLVHWHGSQRDYEHAIGFSRRWLALDPLHEPVHRHLMELYDQAGQRAAALRQYQECGRILHEELGISPSEATTALGEQIRTRPEADRLLRTISNGKSHYLPVQTTPFVGREAVLVEIAELLQNPDCRLLTLVGLGGSGKTRLALEAAKAQLADFQHGVFFVSLAPLESVDAIVPTIAGVLRFSFYQGANPGQQLLDYLRHKNLLLILDNYEHLLACPEPGRGNGAELVVEILKTAQEVKILATSRARLNVGGEYRYPVSGMDCPESSDECAVNAQEYSAVRLFLQATRRAQPDFQLTDDNLSGVLQVCRLVEGMPLAIRLAAAWVQILTPSEIACEISRNLDFLETDRRGIPARQRSMRAAFDHSWNLLSPRERELFEAFSVFRGGCTREAALAVTGASLRELLGLVDKSLLDQDKLGRFQMHELLRQYAAARLTLDPAVEAGVRERHSAFYCTALGAWEADIKGARGRAAFAEIETDLQNVRSAWAWAVAQGRVDQLDRAIEGFCLFYFYRGHYQDAETVLDRAQQHLATRISEGQLSTGDAQRVLAKIVFWRSVFAAWLVKMDLSRELVEQGRALLNSPSLKDTDTRGERALLAVLSGFYGWAGNLEARRRDLEEGLALYQELGDLWHAGVALLYLGNTYRLLSQYENARKAFQESMDSFRALGCIGLTGDVLLTLGFLEQDLGDYERARRCFEQALVISQTEGRIMLSGILLKALGCSALFQGFFEIAVGYLRESIVVVRDAGHRVDVPYLSSRLAAALWFSGAFDQAYTALQEGMAIAREIGDSGALQDVTIHHAWLDSLTGKYREAIAKTTDALYLMQQMSRPPDRGLATGLLGWIALAEERYIDAPQPLLEHIENLREAENREYTAWSLAGLARAELGLANRTKARQHLLEALEIAVEIRAFIPLLHLMPIITLLLAEEDDAAAKERAVELHALSVSHPFLAQAQLFEDVAWRQVRAAIETLPPNVIAAAQERGRALDWWETAAALLNELDWQS